MSLNEVADHEGCAKRTVAKFMVANGIQRRGRLSALVLSQKKLRHKLSFVGTEPDLGYVYGVALGDAHVSERALELCVKDFDFAERFSNVLVNLGFTKIYRAKRTDDLLMVKVYSINLADYILGMRFEDLTREQKISFVNGFFDSEGTVFSKKYSCYRGTHRKVACYNKNKKILLILQSFLKQLGINSFLSKRRMNGGHVIRPQYKKPYVLYQLAIYSKKDLKKFALTFELFKRKQNILEGFRAL